MDYSITIQPRVLQTLESMYIIESSKNPDTVIGRISFFKERLDELKNICFIPSYPINAQKGIDLYKNSYYDLITSNFQLAAIAKPNDFPFADYCVANLYRAYKEWANGQLAAIKSLKQDIAKRKRADKILEMQNTVFKCIGTAALIASPFNRQIFNEMQAQQKEIINEYHRF